MTREMKIRKAISIHGHFVEKVNLFGDMAMKANSLKHQEIHWDKYYRYSVLAQRAYKLTRGILEKQY